MIQAADQRIISSSSMHLFWTFRTSHFTMAYSVKVLHNVLMRISDAHLKNSSLCLKRCTYMGVSTKHSFPNKIGKQWCTTPSSSGMEWKMLLSHGHAISSYVWIIWYCNWSSNFLCAAPHSRHLQDDLDATYHMRYLLVASSARFSALFGQNRIVIPRKKLALQHNHAERRRPSEASACHSTMPFAWDQSHTDTMVAQIQSLLATPH